MLDSKQSAMLFLMNIYSHNGIVWSNTTLIAGYMRCVHACVHKYIHAHSFHGSVIMHFTYLVKFCGMGVSPMLRKVRLSFFLSSDSGYDTGLSLPDGQGFYARMAGDLFYSEPYRGCTICFVNSSSESLGNLEHR